MTRDIAADPVIAAEFDLEKGHRKALDFVDGGPLNVQWLQLNSLVPKKNRHIVILASY